MHVQAQDTALDGRCDVPGGHGAESTGRAKGRAVLAVPHELPIGNGEMDVGMGVEGGAEAVLDGDRAELRPMGETPCDREPDLGIVPITGTNPVEPRWIARSPFGLPASEES